jgi:sterol desaturase/sphingolipid hydroxylase (fatty acid hydroxylase superfamily)
MFTSLIEWLTDAFAGMQTLLFESLIVPMAFAMGAGNLLDVAFEGTGWLLVGILQIVLLIVVISPLEKWRPVEPVTEPSAIKVDVIYTLIHRLGLFSLVMFFTFDNVVETAFGVLRAQGFPTFNIDA